MRKTALLFTFLPILMPYQAYAQSINETVDSSGGQASSSVYREGEIIVTAQKRETSLQDTPLAISAFSSELLERQGIDDVSSLQSYVPAFHVGQEQDGFKVSIRGVGLQGTSSISDPGVALYIDGFYVPRPAGGSSTFFDVNRVEVLRGPQGTLYGRNATGGVVNIIANEPAFKTEGRIGATYGDRDLFELRGVVNAPLSDNVAIRLSGVYNREDGYVRNLGTGPGIDDLFGRDGDYSGRAQLRFTDNNGLDVLLSLNHSDLNGSGVPLKYLERNIGGPPPTRALLATLPPDLADPLEIETDAPSFNDTKTTIAFARATKEFGGVDLFVQVGRLWQDTLLQQDTDGSPVPVSVFTKTQKNDANSAEVRLSSPGSNRISWIVGGYYFDESTFLQRLVTLNGLTPGGMIALPNFLIEEEGKSVTYAAFGSVTVPLGETLSLTGGLRYTHDEREGSKTTFSNFGQPLPPDLTDVKVTYSRVTWKAGLEYRPQDDLLVYASISNGYKAGGFNITSSGQPYAPEEVTAFEVGLKSSPWDGRAQLNLDAYYYDYTNLQLTNLTTVNNAPGQLTTNAAATTIWGIEATGQVQIAPGFVVNASYAFTDATFDEYFNTDQRDPSPVFNPDDPLGLGRADLSGNRLPYVARHTVSAGARYTAELAPQRDLTFVVNSAWHGDKFMREFNAPIDRQEANTKTDASISLALNDIGLTLTGYVNNIENNTELNNVQVSPGFVGLSAVGAYTKPRTFGLRADFVF